MSLSYLFNLQRSLKKTTIEKKIYSNNIDIEIILPFQEIER